MGFRSDVHTAPCACIRCPETLNESGVDSALVAADLYENDPNKLQYCEMSKTGSIVREMVGNTSYHSLILANWPSMCDVYANELARAALKKLHFSAIM